jgi:hypothetical protein
LENFQHARIGPVPEALYQHQGSAEPHIRFAAHRASYRPRGPACRRSGRQSLGRSLRCCPSWCVILFLQCAKQNCIPGRKE